MKQKILAVFTAFVMTVALAACGAGEETTLTGMVVEVDGTVISLMEMDGTFEEGEMPSMPENMEDFQGFGDFNPEDFDGTIPEDFPQRGEGERPEGMTPPEDGEMPEFDGEMPDFGVENGGMMPGFGGFAADGETKQVDIGEAHISVEIDGGKAGGSLEDITPGTFVTITLNSKGEATYVLVSAQSGFSPNSGN